MASTNLSSIPPTFVSIVNFIFSSCKYCKWNGSQMKLFERVFARKSIILSNVIRNWGINALRSGGQVGSGWNAYFSCVSKHGRFLSEKKFLQFSVQSSEAQIFLGNWYVELPFGRKIRVEKFWSLLACRRNRNRAHNVLKGWMFRSWRFSSQNINKWRPITYQTNGRMFHLTIELFFSWMWSAKTSAISLLSRK